MGVATLDIALAELPVARARLQKSLSSFSAEVLSPWHDGVTPRVGAGAVRKRVQRGTTETVFKDGARHALDESETLIGAGK